MGDLAASTGDRETRPVDGRPSVDDAVGESSGDGIHDGTELTARRPSSNITVEQLERRFRQYQDEIEGLTKDLWERAARLQRADDDSAAEGSSKLDGPRLRRLHSVDDGPADGTRPTDAVEAMSGEAVARPAAGHDDGAVGADPLNQREDALLAQAQLELLGAVQDRAARIVEQAERARETTLHEAELHATELIEDARRRSDRLLRQARADARSAVESAQRDAEEAVAYAKEVVAAARRNAETQAALVAASEEAAADALRTANERAKSIVFEAEVEAAQWRVAAAKADARRTEMARRLTDAKSLIHAAALAARTVIVQSQEEADRIIAAAKAEAAAIQIEADPAQDDETPR